MILIMIIAIGVIAAIIDRHTGGHLRKLTFWQLFYISFMSLLLLSTITKT